MGKYHLAALPSSSLEWMVEDKGCKNCLETQTSYKIQFGEGRWEWEFPHEIIMGVVSWGDHPSCECTAYFPACFPACSSPPCSHPLLSTPDFSRPF